MEMKENYTRRCDGEFARHVCAEHPRAIRREDHASTVHKAPLSRHPFSLHNVRNQFKERQEAR